MGRKTLHDVALTFHAETEKAILVSDTKDKFWLAKSLIEYEILKDGTVNVTLPEWLASEKKIVGF